MSVPATGNSLAQGEALLDVGRPAEALRVLTLAAAQDPDNPRLHCLIALAHIRLNQPDAATDAAERAVALDPDQEWSHRLVSVASIQTGNVVRARREAEEAVRLAPGLPEPHQHLARTLVRTRPKRGRRRLSEGRRAAEVAARAIELAPNHPGAYEAAGYVACSRGRLRTARRYFERTLQLDPDNVVALNNLSVIRMRRGRLLSAMSGFRTVAALDPASDLGRHNLDAAITSALRYATLAGVGLVFLASASPAVRSALVLVPPLVLGFCWWVRRRVGPAVWSYLRGLPRTEWPVAVWLGGLAVGYVSLTLMALAPAADDAPFSPFHLAWYSLAGSLFVGRYARMQVRNRRRA